MLFNCVHIISISSLTMNCCFFGDISAPCWLSALLIPTHFPRVLRLNGEFRFELAIRASNILHRDDKNQGHQRGPRRGGGFFGGGAPATGDPRPKIYGPC